MRVARNFSSETWEGVTAGVGKVQPSAEAGTVVAYAGIP